MPKNQKLNKYKVSISEYVKGKKPKVWTVYAPNHKEAEKIAKKRIKIVKVKNEVWENNDKQEDRIANKNRNYHSRRYP